MEQMDSWIFFGLVNVGCFVLGRLWGKLGSIEKGVVKDLAALHAKADQLLALVRNVSGGSKS